MYNRLRSKSTFLVVTVLLLLWLVSGIVVINDMRNQLEMAVMEKAKSDLATALQIIDYMYPGNWEARGDTLYKGNTKINGNDQIVDKIGTLTNDTVTVFLQDTRIATNVIREGKRAAGTKAADYVQKLVLEQGKIYIGKAEVVGVKVQTCYAPIRDANGMIIGMFYVGVSQKFADQLQQTFTAVAVLSARITLLFALAVTCFIPFDAWSKSFTDKSISSCTLATRTQGYKGTVLPYHADKP
jgi:sensor histidine kinase regulating citrate/malate metabolism